MQPKPAQRPKVELIARDRYRRSVGKVKCAGIDAGARQVATGLAWMYDRHNKPNSPLNALQDEAKAARRALWADNEPAPPWEWRRGSARQAGGATK